MALIKSFRTPFSADLILAYFRVTVVSLDFTKEEGRIEVSIYFDKASRIAGKDQIGSLTFNLTKNGSKAIMIDGTELIKQNNGVYKDPAGNVVVPYQKETYVFDSVVNGPALVGNEKAGVKIFDLAKSAIYSLLKTFPEFAGSQDDI